MAKTGTNSESMQTQNRSLILQILSKNETCTRTELAERTGLTQASISKIIGDMIEAGIVTEAGNTSGKLGRRSISISLNKSICKVVAVKIARKSYDVAVFLPRGDLVCQIHNASISNLTPKEIVEQIKSQVRQYLSTFPDIKAIGVAVPGPYLRNEGRIAIMSEVCGWEELSIIDEFTKEFNLPVCVEHDANASAFAEWCYSEQYGYNERGTIISFLASEGTGAGVINDGEILRGVDGVAGEIGHMSINFKGPRCVCGNCGCLEMYSSALAFARMVEKDLKEHPESLLNRETQITAETVFRYMNQGDPFCVEEVRKVGRYIGYGMANLIYLYNPSEIIMTDIMTGGGEVLLKSINEAVCSRVLPVLSESVIIRMTSLSHDSILMGAAALALDLLLTNPEILYS